jgi:hypothetical protein
MDKVHTIHDDTDMTRCHARRLHNQDIPRLEQAQRITVVTLKPDFLHLRRRRDGVRVQVDAPTLTIEGAQQVPTMTLGIGQPQ